MPEQSCQMRAQTQCCLSPVPHLRALAPHLCCPCRCCCSQTVETKMASQTMQQRDQDAQAHPDCTPAQTASHVGTVYSGYRRREHADKLGPDGTPRCTLPAALVEWLAGPTTASPEWHHRCSRHRRRCLRPTHPAEHDSCNALTSFRHRYGELLQQTYTVRIVAIQAFAETLPGGCPCSPDRQHSDDHASDTETRQAARAPKT